MGILPEDIAKVRDATDFVALAQEHVALKQSGRRYSGLCPFHTEKSPSFSISPERGFYYCFGCQASGDVIRFVMELEQLDFIAAVERLAAKAGITVRHDESATASRDRVRKGRLSEILDRAAAFYHDQLLTSPEGGAARRYLRERGLDGDAVRAFQLGWAPNAWDTVVRQLNLTPELARDTGLGLVNKNGRLNDFFRGRLLFPIFDITGSPVGFGGRILPGGEGPKYRNSPETPLYSKSRVLYGLNWAKAEVARLGEVIVCEGYTDVIAFHRAGMPRAVATCGTALADEHFRILKNYSRRIVLAYDADSAGQHAAERFYEWERRYEVDLAVVALPEGRDPADVARQDPALLAEAVASARPFLAFRVERILAGAQLNSAEGRAKAFETAAAAIFEHPSPFVREDYLRQVAGRCQISQEAMARVLRDGVTPTSRKSPSNQDRGSGSGRTTVSDRGGSGRGSRTHDGYDGSDGYDGYGGRDEGDGSDARPAGREDGRRDGLGDRTRGERGQDRRGDNRGAGRGSRGEVRGRASSPDTYADAVAQRSSPLELEVLRHAAQNPDEVLEHLHPCYFVDPIRAAAMALLHKSAGDVHVAIDLAKQDGHDDQVVSLLYRVAVEVPDNDDPLEAVAHLVRITALRAIAELARSSDAQDQEEAGRYKPLLDRLDDPMLRPTALLSLVPFLLSWGTRPNSATQ